MSKDTELEGESKSSIRIVDRRRFDSDGEEKINSSTTETLKVAPAKVEEIVKPVESAPAAVAPAAADTGFTMQDPGDHEIPLSEESDISFGSFVLSLATQALMQLGQLKAPDGMSIQVDPAAAHQTIDILAMLQTKTKGNLDVREEGLLRDALHSLRLAFLKFR